MNNLKTYESYNKNWIITVEISENTMKEAYWDVYYPVAKEEIVFGEYGDIEIMDYDDFVEGTLDGIWGDIRLFLNHKLNFNVDYDYKNMRNVGINIDMISMNFKTDLVPTENDMSKLNSFLNENLPQYLNNLSKSVSDIKWSIYVNGAHFNTGEKQVEKSLDYSNISQSEIKKLIDNALDVRDFQKVKILSQYLKESIILKFKNFINS